MDFIKILTTFTAIGLSSPLFGCTVLFEEDFTSATLPTTTQAYLGFWSNFATYGEISVSSNASIEDVGGNNVLELNSTSDFRGIGIALDAASLAGAGTYTLGLNVLDFGLYSNGQPVSATNDATLEVSVYSANGYAQNTSDGLALNAQTGDLAATSGTPVSTLLANQSISLLDATNTGQFNLTFDYNGTDDAIVLYIGATADGWPFPQIQIDDITLSTCATAPEPSSLLLTACASIFLFRRRRV